MNSSRPDLAVVVQLPHHRSGESNEVRSLNKSNGL
jgi:hypothetical protein